MRALVVTAPDSLCHQLRDLSRDRLIAVTADALPGRGRLRGVWMDRPVVVAGAGD